MVIALYYSYRTASYSTAELVIVRYRILFFFVYVIRLTYTILWTYSFGYLLFTYTTLVPVRTGYV